MFNKDSFFANISTKATSPERKFAVDQAWRSFHKGTCNSPKDVLDIITYEYSMICYEKGFGKDYIDEHLAHFGTVDNATKIFKLFKMFTSEDF